MPVPNHISWGGSSSPAHTSITGLESWALSKRSCEESSRQHTPSPRDAVKKSAAAATSAVKMADSARSSEADQQPEQQQATSPKRLQLPQKACAGDLSAARPETAWKPHVSSPGPVASLGVTLLPSTSINHQSVARPAQLQPAASLSLSSATGSTAGAMSSGGGGGGGVPSSGVFQVLVEVLLRQKGGRAYVVQQLEEMDASQVTVPLQLSVSHSFL